MHEFLRDEIPDRELQVLPRPADQLLEVGDEDARLLRLEPPPRVEHLENRRAHELFGREIVLRLYPFRDDPPAILALALVYDVVLRPPSGIAHDFVRLPHVAETRGVPCCLDARGNPQRSNA